MRASSVSSGVVHFVSAVAALVIAASCGKTGDTSTVQGAVEGRNRTASGDHSGASGDHSGDHSGDNSGDHSGDPAGDHPGDNPGDHHEEADAGDNPAEHHEPDAGTAEHHEDAGEPHHQVACEAAGNQCFADEHMGACPDGLTHIALDCALGRICCAPGATEHDAGTSGEPHPDAGTGGGEHHADAGGGDEAPDAGRH